MHGRVRQRRRPGAHQPPLRLQLHSETLHRGARLPDQRLLGHDPRAGDTLPGADGDEAGVHAGRHQGGARRRDGGHERGRPRDHHREQHQGRQRQSHGRHALQGSDQALLLRQPVLHVRQRGVHRRAPGGSPAEQHRQVWRRHGQLDVAAPHGRLQHVPRVCGRQQQTRRLQQGQRALPPAEAPGDKPQGSGRGRLHLRLRLPRHDTALCDARLRGPGRQPGEPRAHSATHHTPRPLQRRHAPKRCAETEIRLAGGQHRQRLEEVAGREPRHRAPARRGAEDGAGRAVPPVG